VKTQLGRRRFGALQERLRPILSKRRLTELLEDLHPKVSAYDAWNLVTACGQQYYGRTRRQVEAVGGWLLREVG